MSNPKKYTNILDYNPKSCANILDLKLVLRPYLMNGPGIYGV